MIHTLKLQGYRSFKSYELFDLARVNLLVGKNNCGKTSILEAAHLLVSQGSPKVLVEPAYQRGEINVADRETVGQRPQPDSFASVSHLFRGHRCEPGRNFEISSSDPPRKVRVDIVDDNNVDLDARQQSLFDAEAGTGGTLALRIFGGGANGPLVFPVSANGSFSFRYGPRIWSSSMAIPVHPPARLVTAESLGTASMRGMWDNVVIAGSEDRVIAAMRLLDPSLRSIHFLSDTRRVYKSDASGIVLGFGTGARRVPIGSQGDGMRRLLALSLCLTEVAGGYLLIDEIDTGIHWTVMQDMWKLVVETARRAGYSGFCYNSQLRLYQRTGLVRGV